jgi:hypothetical protein
MARKPTGCGCPRTSPARLGPLAHRLHLVRAGDRGGSQETRRHRRSFRCLNTDGSLDFHFGPERPAAPGGNWIETVPGIGYCLMFRF